MSDQLQCANPECGILLDDQSQTYKRDGKIYCEVCVDVLFSDRDQGDEDDSESRSGTPAPMFDLLGKPVVQMESPMFDLRKEWPK